MKRLSRTAFIAMLVTLLHAPAWGSASRSIDADTIKSSDHTKTYTLPSSTSTLLSTASTIPVSQLTPATQAISSTTIDWSLGSVFTKTLSANTTFTFSNQVSGQTIIVRLTNTASNYTVTWPGGVLWPGGTPPTETVGAKSDVITFVYDGTNTYGNSVQNF